MSAGGIRSFPTGAESHPVVRVRPSGPPRSWLGGDLVGRLRETSDSLSGLRSPRRGLHTLPSRAQLSGIATQLRAALFPVHFGPPDISSHSADTFVGHTLQAALEGLSGQVHKGLHFACDSEDVDCVRCERRADEVVSEFARSLPDIRRLLERDVRAAFDGDPAATSADEALLCYPGVAAIIHHRLAHRLHQLGVPLVPRIISEFSHSTTGIDIHPGAEIGGSFFIDHGTGVVIGETCLIGERVRIYQGVTLGARSFDVDDAGRIVKGLTRHPLVEDDVVIYAGATILGRITIGRGSIVGGNVWLTTSVPPRSRITQAQAQSAVFQDGAGI